MANTTVKAALEEQSKAIAELKAIIKPKAETTETEVKEEVKEEPAEETMEDRIAALEKRCAALEEKLKDKEVETEETAKALRESSDMLRAAAAAFRDPAKMQALFSGVGVMPVTVEAKAQQEVDHAAVWGKLTGAEANAYFAAHREDILKTING